MRLLKKKSIVSACTLSAALLLMACKKKKEAEPEEHSGPEVVQSPQASAEKYSQLKVGNYWIYDVTYWLNVSTPNPSDTAAHTGLTDSCYISKDTLINGAGSSRYAIHSHTTPTFTAMCGIH